MACLVVYVYVNIKEIEKVYICIGVYVCTYQFDTKDVLLSRMCLWISKRYEGCKSLVYVYVNFKEIERVLSLESVVQGDVVCCSVTQCNE